MKKQKCIYCLLDKEEKNFDREHVVPRLMGTYQDGFVLNKNQVCKECNSYFSINIENEIALDSYEALLRIKHRNKKMSDDRKLGSNRIKLRGDEGIFNGIVFDVKTDKSRKEKMKFEIPMFIGIIENHQKKEYKYYTLDKLPKASDHILEKIKREKDIPGIVTTSVEKASKKEIEKKLYKQGYIDKNNYLYSEKSIRDFADDEEFNVEVSLNIDGKLRRLCAKTLFNYLCYKEGKEFVLDEKFDNIRNYIRYGKWTDDLWFRYSTSPVSEITILNKFSHNLGYMWYSNPNDLNWSLCGCVTWYGQMTYIFHIGNTNHKVISYNNPPSTNFACFDNDDLVIEEENFCFIYDGIAHG